MRVVLCVTNETVGRLWKGNLKPTGYKRKIIENEENLMRYLSKHKDTQIVVCVEDIWVGNNFENLKELIIALKSLYQNLPILVLSRFPNYSTGKTILSLGINGYGNLRMLSVHLQDAIESIKKGDVWVYPEFVQMMIKSINATNPSVAVDNKKLEELSPREKEISKLIYEGHSNKEIAAMTNITLRTVKAHTTSIYEKLNVKDRVALVLLLKESRD